MLVWWMVVTVGCWVERPVGNGGSSEEVPPGRLVAEGPPVPVGSTVPDEPPVPGRLVKVTVMKDPPVPVPPKVMVVVTMFVGRPVIVGTPLIVALGDADGNPVPVPVPGSTVVAGSEVVGTEVGGSVEEAEVVEDGVGVGGIVGALVLRPTKNTASTTPGPVTISSSSSSSTVKARSMVITVADVPSMACSNILTPVRIFRRTAVRG